MKARIREVSRAIRSVQGRIRLITHLDSDGISACSILTRMLHRLGKQYTTSAYPQLTSKAVEQLAEESFDCYLFADFGSAHIDDFARLMPDKKVIILDHHLNECSSHENVICLNPHDYKIDGGRDVSSSGLAFLVARQVDEGNKDMAHIALIGAIGDVQEHDGFHGINLDILKVAEDLGLVEVKTGVRFFGTESRPLHKVIAYSSELLIPEVSGSEKSAILFLRALGIQARKGKSWRRINDLSNEEKVNLIRGIIQAREGEVEPADIFTNIYTLPGEKGVYSNAKEFSVVLNACGRLNKASVGVGICLGDVRMKEKGRKLLQEYKHEIVQSLNWITKERKEGNGLVSEDGGSIMVNAGMRIPSTMIGTISSVLARSTGKLVIGLAENIDDTVKISMRSGHNTEVDLRKMALGITEGIRLEAGGHKNAAGALIHLNDEKLLLEKVRQWVSPDQGRSAR